MIGKNTLTGKQISTLATITLPTILKNQFLAQTHDS